LTVLPVLDVHTGFPYSLIDQSREFIGPRDSVRFPRFTSLDLQVTRPIPIRLPHEKFKARIGFSVFNVLNHFNPRDVQNDIDSDRFGALFNGVGRTFRGKSYLSSSHVHDLVFFRDCSRGFRFGSSHLSGDQVVARMIARDNERQSTFNGYTAARRYVLENRRHHSEPKWWCA